VQNVAKIHLLLTSDEMPPEYAAGNADLPRDVPGAWAAPARGGIAHDVVIVRPDILTARPQTPTGT